MDVLQKIKQWLSGYPQWGEAKIYVDFLESDPVNTGLYPQGLEELERREDVLGNVAVRCRYRFVLYRMTTGQQDNEENAGWLLNFQQWVQQQNTLRQVPQFGDVPNREQIRAEKGKLQKASQVGTGTYGVILTVDFMKIYEVSNNGKN